MPLSTFEKLLRCCRGAAPSPASRGSPRTGWPPVLVRRTGARLGAGDRRPQRSERRQPVLPGRHGGRAALLRHGRPQPTALRRRRRGDLLQRRVRRLAHRLGSPRGWQWGPRACCRRLRTATRRRPTRSATRSTSAGWAWASASAPRSSPSASEGCATPCSPAGSRRPPPAWGSWRCSARCSIPPGGLINYVLLPFWLIAASVVLSRRQDTAGRGERLLVQNA